MNDDIRESLLEAMDEVMEQCPDQYAELMVMPFSYLPAYAMEDPDSEWWGSDEAKSKLHHLMRILEGYDQ